MAKLIPDCVNSAVNWNFKWTTWRFLGWASSHSSKIGRYVTKASLRHITANDEVSSLSGDFIIAHHSPATRFKKGEDRRKKKRKVLHLLRCYTHTPGQSRVNPERQEEEKSGHTKGKRPKTAQGGRGTDEPPEPTYTAKRTWTKQRTHLNPTTHYGEARGEIRDQMGD